MKTTHPTSIRKLVTLWDKSYDFTTGLKSFDKDSRDIHDVRFMSDVIGYITLLHQRRNLVRVLPTERV
jgi:hypothetical protein